MSSISLEQCIACRANRGKLTAPGGVIYRDELWVLEHILEPIPMAGWLVLKPIRHVESIAELTAEESASLGPLLQWVTAAMTGVLAPAKIYVCMFAESLDCPHIHFHLIPRTPDVPGNRRGPNIFRYLSVAGTTGRSHAKIDEAVHVAAAVRERLEIDRQTTET